MNLESLQRAMQRLAEGDLETRLPEERAGDLSRLASTFNEMAVKIQAQVDDERAFASHVAHELQTPLTSIRLRSEALRKGIGDPELARQTIIEIDEEVMRMANLVNDLILLSRFEAGRAEPGHEQVDPERLARALLKELVPWAEGRGVNLDVEILDDLPTIEASLNHLRVVFRNLLENAIKYTPAGGRVTWRLWAEDGTLRTELIDTGQGIATEDMPHLFERFYRADSGRGRLVPGTGLGLSLTHSIINTYSGRIDIHSPGPGQGTTVNVWWPVGESVKRET